MNTYIETQIPDYEAFSQFASSMDLDFSCSELHGLICGFLCVGKAQEAEDYARALCLMGHNEKNRELARLVNQLFAYTQHQLHHFDFSFTLFLPQDDAPLAERAEAFSAWCRGFIHGLTQAGFNVDALEHEESQDLIVHIEEFAELDYDTLEMSEEDEKAFLEVSEYARMSVLQLYAEIHATHRNDNSGEASTTH